MEMSCARCLMARGYYRVAPIYVCIIVCVQIFLGCNFTQLQIKMQMFLECVPGKALIGNLIN